jgi:hypothetical protein
LIPYESVWRGGPLIPLPFQALRLSSLIPHESVWRVGGIDDPDFPSEASRLLILIPYESVWGVRSY